MATDSHATPDWMRFFPAADHRWVMGLRPGDAAEFFAARDTTGAVCAERNCWLAQDVETYAALLPEAEPALRETVELARSLGVVIDGTLPAGRHCRQCSLTEWRVEFGCHWRSLWAASDSARPEPETGTAAQCDPPLRFEDFASQLNHEAVALGPPVRAVRVARPESSKGGACGEKATAFAQPLTVPPTMIRWLGFYSANPAQRDSLERPSYAGCHWRGLWLASALLTLPNTGGPERPPVAPGEVHSPVPGLNDALAGKIETFFDRQESGVAWTRENASFSRDAELNHHPSRRVRPLDANVTAEDVWIRIEHQLLLKLPCSGSILFGIRLEIVSLPVLMQAPPAAA